VEIRAHQSAFSEGAFYCKNLNFREIADIFLALRRQAEEQSIEPVCISVNTIRDLEGFNVHSLLVEIHGWYEFRSWLEKVDMERLVADSGRKLKLLRFLRGFRNALESESWEEMANYNKLEISFRYK
jgi:hypothetical protein